MLRLDKLSKQGILPQVVQPSYFLGHFPQVVDIEVEGEVVIHHKLVNCLHDGKERLAMTQHLVIIHFGDSEDFVYFITEKGG